uniref:G_PROTEIN_RECEP_F1_2 domain-containing protein n=1 Tax=Steinernema glaseri TaxID=37863 RepID=A0A1I8AMB3_9BILA
MFSVPYTAVFILSYGLTVFSIYISWSLFTKNTRCFTYFLVAGRVLNCLLLFMWNIVLQPEFLDQLMCLRMHGVASTLPKYVVHLCVCVALICICTISLYYTHSAVYYLLVICFRDMEKKLFSGKYLSIAFFIYLLNGTLIFGLVYESVNLEAFPTENNVVCYMLSPQKHSKYVAMFTCAYVGFLIIISMAMMLLLFRFLQRNQTDANKKEIKAVVRTMTIMGLAPFTMAALPFLSIFTWSLFVSSSSALTLFSNISSHVAMMHYGVLIIVALLLLKPYRSAVLQMTGRKKVERVFIRTRTMAVSCAQ